MKRPVLRLASRLLAGSAILLCASRATAQSPAIDPAKPVTIGRWTARFQRGGLFLDFDGIPLLKGGLVQVFSKDYQRGYYGSSGNPPVGRVETLPDGGRAYLAPFRYQGEGYAFEADERIEVHPDNRVLFTLKARWNGREPAALEWNAARFWAYPLLGGRYTARMPDGRETGGVIGLRAAANGYPGNQLSPPWQQFTLRGTGLGDFALSGENANVPPIVLDARNDVYLKDEKLFWWGYIGSELPPGQEIVNRLMLTLTPKNALPPVLIPGQSHPPMLLPTQATFVRDALASPRPPRDVSGNPLLIPEPKQARFTDDDFPLAGRIPVVTDLPNDESGRRITGALRELTEEIRQEVHLRWLPRTAWKGRGILVTLADRSSTKAPHLETLPRPSPLQGEGASVFSSPLRRRRPGEGSSSFLPSLTGASADSSAGQAEGYRLLVTPRAVIVVGNDAAGAFYGLQTLRQLLRIGKKGALGFAGADITDWPSLRVRGAHLFVGRNALPFHKKLISRIFARYKLNTLILECEYSQWKSHPEIHVANSMPLHDLRAEVAYARDHFLEPVPLINSLGHCEWMFKNGRNLALAEDVTHPYAYDASNPETYRFLFDIYQEALDIFRPRLFHIGHDEVKILGDDQFGRYPARPQNIQKGATALFVEDVRRLSDWLRVRKVRTMLWGDMLLHSSEGEAPEVQTLTAANAPTPEEAARRRQLLPPDVMIADWRYEPGNEQRNGLGIFQKSGWEALGCAWFQPENIRGWARQAIQQKALGTLQTTWAGYDSNEALLGSEFRQFSAFVLAAEYAWSGAAKRPRRPEEAPIEAQAEKTPTLPPASNDAQPAQPIEEALPYEASIAFTRAYRQDRIRLKPRPGWCLPLGKAANIMLQEAEEGLPWTGYARLPAAKNGSLHRLLTDPLTGAILRQLGPTPGGIMLHGALNPPCETLSGKPIVYPEAVRLPIKARARTLALLHATGLAVAPNTTVATYSILYSDGQRLTLPLRYGREIRALDDSAPTNSFAVSPIRWQAKNGVPLTLRLLQWINPRPTVPIAQIVFRAVDPNAAPAVFAVTGY